MPAPAAGAQAKFLRGDATWQTIASVATKAYITETWSSGTSWYRKYSDGWIEQGGRISGTATRQFNNKTITFHTGFSNTNYTISGMIEVVASAIPGDDVGAPLEYHKKTTTSVIVGAYSYRNGNNVTAISWYACGY